MKSKKIKVAIEGTKLASGLGVGYMVANLCGALIPAEAKLVMRGCAFVGTLGIQGAVNNKANEYWDELGDVIEESIEAAKALINEDKKKKKPKKKESKVKQKPYSLSDEVFKAREIESLRKSQRKTKSKKVKTEA